MLPDIRQVIDSLAGKSTLLYASKDRGVGFQWLGLRQADYSKKCSCEAVMGTSEPIKCLRCLSTGYRFTDYLVKGYMWMGLLGTEVGTKPGLISTQQRNLVVQHNRVISKFDHIIELDQDPDTGKIRQPFSILKYYRVQDSVPIKGDTGRIEFWKCSLEERNVEDGRPGIDGTTYNYWGNRSNSEPN